MVVMVAQDSPRNRRHSGIGRLRREIVETAGEWYTSQIQEQFNQQGYLELKTASRDSWTLMGTHGARGLQEHLTGSHGEATEQLLHAKPHNGCYDVLLDMWLQFLLSHHPVGQAGLYVDTNIVPLSVAWGVLIVVEVACAVIPLLRMFTAREFYDKA